MNATPVIAVFDIGKTNKKILLFDRQYNIVYEEETTLSETTDDDGFACENIDLLAHWVKETFDKLFNQPAWDIRALNFSTYGASLVHIDNHGKPLTPLYNYLKPIDPVISRAFYNQFGLPEFFSYQTGSPVLQMLNSGIQLFWLKERYPAIAQQVDKSLHLPQYLNFLFTGEKLADITSIGCHTGLWDVHKHTYHEWLNWQGIAHWLPAPAAYTDSRIIAYNGKPLIVGIGMHDSSASLLPFITHGSTGIGILSTGTWNILLLPSFPAKLAEEDYTKDCLFYLLGIDEPVAAARIFTGNEFDHQLLRLNNYFNKPPDHYKKVKLDHQLLAGMIQEPYALHFIPETMQGSGPLPNLKGPVASIDAFADFETAYHKLIADMAWLQKQSANILLDKSNINRIYITGGFARNEVFVHALKLFMPEIDGITSSIAQGTALGAALALHNTWNPTSAIPAFPQKT